MFTKLQAANIAWADRAKYIGDADFVDVPVSGLLDPRYAAERRKMIHSDFKSVPLPIEPGRPPVNHIQRCLLSIVILTCRSLASYL